MMHVEIYNIRQICDHFHAQNHAAKGENGEVHSSNWCLAKHTDQTYPCRSLPATVTGPGCPRAPLMQHHLTICLAQANWNALCAALRSFLSQLSCRAVFLRVLNVYHCMAKSLRYCFVPMLPLSMQFKWLWLP